MRKKIDLNDNDNKLLGFCYHQRKTVAEISRHLAISPKNVSVRLPKLEKAGLIKIEYSSNKTFVRTIEGDKTRDYFLELLKQLDESGGEMKEEDFLSLIPFNFANPEDQDKFSAPMKLMHTHPKLVEKHIKITPVGINFLKEHQK